MRFFTRILAVVAGFFPATAGAMTLELPSKATHLAQRFEPHADYSLPIGAWTKTGMQNLDTAGAFSQQSWKIDDTALSTLEILDGLRQQLAGGGFDILFECATDACGGFDFRYETEVFAEPDMHVDLGDFRFLSAKRSNDDAPEYLSLMVSRSANTGFVQQINVGGPTPQTPATEPTVEPPSTSTSTSSSPSTPDIETVPNTSLEHALEDRGHFVLEDLAFQTGSSLLGENDFASLALLARYLSDHPDRKIALVGHTDAEGSLDSNVSLSKKRASAVLTRLVNTYDVDPSQLSAQGMGFLAPRSSNLTDDGRTQNRRVEVILTSID